MAIFHNGLRYYVLLLHNTLRQNHKNISPSNSEVGDIPNLLDSDNTFREIEDLLSYFPKQNQTIYIYKSQYNCWIQFRHNKLKSSPNVHALKDRKWKKSVLGKIHAMQDTNYNLVSIPPKNREFWRNPRYARQILFSKFPTKNWVGAKYVLSEALCFEK